MLPSSGTTVGNHRDGIGLVGPIRSLNQVNAGAQAFDGQLLRLAHDGRRCHEFPSRHKLAGVQHRNLRKLRGGYNPAPLAQLALLFAEGVPRLARELPAEEVPHAPPEVGFEVLQPLDPRALVNPLRGRFVRAPKLCKSLNPEKNL
jgi:hypothetical protein